MMSIFLGRFVIYTSFCGLAFVRCTCFVYVFGHEWPINGDGYNANFRRSFRYLLCRAFEFHVGNEDHFIRGRGQEVFRSDPYGTSALALSTKGFTSTITSVNVMSLQFFRSRVIHVNGLNYFGSLFRNYSFRSGDSIIRRDVVGRGDFLISVPGRATRIIGNCFLSVNSISNSFSLLCIIVA